MSRSYKKVYKVGICRGTNTQWRRYTASQRREHDRQQMNHLRKYYEGTNMNSLVDDEEFVGDFAIKNTFPYCEDEWCQPTDGSITFHNKGQYLRNQRLWNMEKDEKESDKEYLKGLRK